MGLVLFLLLLCIHFRFWSDASFDHVSNPHTHWKCTIGCENFNQEGIRSLFGIIRHAMIAESREVYLSFDHSWMERALERYANVDIIHVQRHELATFIHTRDKSTTKPVGARWLDGRIPKQSPRHIETFHVVVSLSPEYYATISASENKNKSVVIMSDSQQSEVDQFLTMNPCFIPLKDPPVTTWDAVEYPNITLDALALSYDDPHAVVLMELPLSQFNATCNYYTLITQRQFPKTCPEIADQNTTGTPRDKYYAYYLNDVGWANCMHTLFDYMKIALEQGRVFITPKSISRHDANPMSVPVSNDFIVPSDAIGPWGRPAKIDIDANGKKTLAMRNYWSTWTDMEGCPNDTFAWNPWACNFITLTHCNTPTTYFVKEGKDFRTNESTILDHAYVTQFPIIYEDSKQQHDGYHIGRSEWERIRLLVFLMRPNVYLRYRIKNALKRLSHIKGTKGHGPGLSNVNHTTMIKTNTANTPPKNRLNMMMDTHLHQLGGPTVPLQGQCLALHVRNGDSVNDRRNDDTKGMDRSIDGHMRCVKNMTKSMGIHAIFLATDNNTLFSMAKTWYPEYQWYYQRRPLSKY